MGAEPKCPEVGFGAQARAQEVLAHMEVSSVMFTSQQGSLWTASDGLHVIHLDSQVSSLKGWEWPEARSNHW